MREREEGKSFNIKVNHKLMMFEGGWHFYYRIGDNEATKLENVGTQLRFFFVFSLFSVHYQAKNYTNLL